MNGGTHKEVHTDIQLNETCERTHTYTVTKICTYIHHAYMPVYMYVHKIIHTFVRR